MPPMPTPEAQREYQRQWIAKRRAAYLQGKSCIECGATEQLELDHRVPAEKVAHSIWSWSWERIRDETAKCDIKCRQCHMERHRAERIRHGTNGRYDKGCRCDICRKAKALKNRGIGRPGRVYGPPMPNPPRSRRRGSNT